MRYKALIAIITTLVIVLSVSAMVPLSSGNQVAPSGTSANFGMNLSGSINNHFQHMHNYGARLSYNTTTGNITGKYLTANFNSTTGVFSNVTYNLTSTTIISKMYANGTSITGIKLPFIGSSHTPSINASAFGSMFLYVNTTSFFVMHNNPALQSNMMVNNGTLYLYVPSTAHIYNTTDNFQASASADMNMNEQANASVFKNANFADHTMINFNNVVNAGRKMIMIDNNGTVAMLFVHNGNFKITKNEIIINSTASHGPVLVNMVVPPGLQKTSNNSMVINNIMKGKISSQIALNYVNGTIANSTINYNSSIHFMYTGHTSSTNSFDVNSSVNHHTIVAVFIGNNMTKNTGHAYVKFDGKIATYVTMSALVNETSTTHAYYSYTNTSSGMYVFMYIPHFSNHTMVVSNEPFKNSSYTEYYIGGGIIAVLALIGVAAYVIKKKK
ncbi:MAG TPA: hypothetical protein HA269_04935 [Ferroplasma sp.]|nr:hypothetical protein [Ferroplasma sp.]HII82607.1 hypothetical protein [Ferroplasma sp.]